MKKNPLLQYRDQAFYAELFTVQSWLIPFCTVMMQLLCIEALTATSK